LTSDDLFVDLKVARHLGIKVPPRS